MNEAFVRKVLKIKTIWNMFSFNVTFYSEVVPNKTRLHETRFRNTTSVDLNALCNEHIESTDSLYMR